MSFALPSIKPKPSLPQSLEDGHNTPYGVPEYMTTGLVNSRQDPAGCAHPLAASEGNYHKNQNMMNMTVLRNTQGLHAPLRIAMELKAAKQIGHLPFLPSHDIMFDALTGRDLAIGPEDVFGTAEFKEAMGQPHAVVERSAGLL